MKLLFVLSLLVLAVAGDVWLDEALSFQRALTKDVPIDQVSRPCAHNAFNSLGSLPEVIVEYQHLIAFEGSIYFNNQLMTLTELLDAGVRQIQVEVHYVEDLNKTLVCHYLPIFLDFCPIIEGGTGMTCEEAAGLIDLGIHTGCHPFSFTWEAHVTEIATWVAAHPDEILVIEIVDYVTGEPEAIPEQFAGPFLQHLAPFALSNGELTTFRASSSNDWPSATEMNTLDKSLIITGTSFPSIQEYILDLNSASATPVANFTSGDCNSLDPIFTSFYESALKLIVDIVGVDINFDESTTTGAFDSTKIEEVIDCGFTACVDHVDFNKLSAMVWTWDTGLSTVACEEDSCAVLSLNENRWSHQPCNASYALACKSDNDGSWSVVGASGSKNSLGPCDSGYTFALPQTSQDNAALKAAIQSEGVDGVWLNIDLTFDNTHALCTYVAPSAGAITSYSLFLTLGALVVSLFVSRF